MEYPKYHPGLLPQITSQPTREPVPTQAPTTAQPTKAPTQKPTAKPTSRPTLPPTKRPTKAPTLKPVTAQPTKTPTGRPTTSPTMGGPCPLFNLDFSQFTRGQYITNDTKAAYGVSIAATAFKSCGYTPGGAARIFDTAIPDAASGGDAGLGSPNQGCYGPGVGSGGVNTSAYRNWIPQGNVLVIQKGNQATPCDDGSGGTITFTFDNPVDLETVTLMNIASSATAATMTVRCIGIINDGTK